MNGVGRYMNVKIWNRNLLFSGALKSQLQYYISEVMMMELSSFHFCSVGQLRNEVVAHFPFPFLKEPNLNSRHTCSEKNWDNHVTKFLENAVDKWSWIAFWERNCRRISDQNNALEKIGKVSWQPEKWRFFSFNAWNMYFLPVVLSYWKYIDTFKR